MDFKEINDQELGHRLLSLVRQERKLTSQILDYLKEVEDRKLFAKRGYPSLFSYCTEFLGYTESAAQRRISSMRLLREIPQIKEQITSGELSLSNISKAASFFRQEQKINERIYTSQEKTSSVPQRKCPPPLRRNLSKAERHQVWKKAKASCQFKDHKSEHFCQSIKGLEIDHIRPLALGGNNQIENLRLLCREHHKLFTEMSFA